jgi:hypothetical protein
MGISTHGDIAMPHSKKCFKCNEIKTIDSFYKHSSMTDGRLNKCIVCTRLDALVYRNANLDKVRAYDRERGLLPHRIALSLAVSRAWRNEDKRRTRCHNAVARAIKKGHLTRLDCEKCGNNKSVGHHEDYDKPLDIIWLCDICHKQRHKEILTVKRLNIK